LIFLLMSYLVVGVSLYFGMPPNRTTFVMPVTIGISRFVLSREEKRSIVQQIWYATKRIKKRQLKVLVTITVLMGVTLVAGLYGKVAGELTDLSVVELVKAGVALQANEFTDSSINLKLDAFLETVGKSDRVDLVFANSITVFTFAVPESIRGGAELNIMERLSEVYPFLKNYLEPFFHQYVEGGIIGLIVYSIIFLQVLIFISKQLLSNPRGIDPCYVLPICTYMYIAYTYGFTRFMLPYGVASCIVILADSLSRNRVRCGEYRTPR
jgi:hypothetical protein